MGSYWVYSVIDKYGNTVIEIGDYPRGFYKIYLCSPNGWEARKKANRLRRLLNGV